MRVDDRVDAVTGEVTAGDVDPMVTEFAEQFSADVSGVETPSGAAFAERWAPMCSGDDDDLHRRLRAAGAAGLAALGVAGPDEPTEWDHDTDP